MCTYEILARSEAIVESESVSYQYSESTRAELGTTPVKPKNEDLRILALQTCYQDALRSKTNFDPDGREDCE